MISVWAPNADTVEIDALADGEPLRIEPQTWREREDLSKPSPVGEFQI